MRASNAAVHWMVMGKNRRIFSFDLVHEVFTELPLPPGEGYYKNIVAMGGYLTVFCNPSNGIWVMKECGVKGSWTKQIIFYDSLGCSYTPVQFWNGKILLQRNRKELVLYTTKSKTVRNLRIQGLPINFKAFIHTKSLVMLKD
ncbi:F-box protein At3g07870-like [Macadamia integrifolia]|uniref:F-box protein At3g07870-like n=1 Tax=Macadamia integrifolia TaxID=60698 RepID=UPI001C4EC067|nr:F-box protein At3g07870-like [Macadamia integrifolia]